MTSSDWVIVQVVDLGLLSLHCILPQAEPEALRPPEGLRPLGSRLLCLVGNYIMTTKTDWSRIEARENHSHDAEPDSCCVVNVWTGQDENTHDGRLGKPRFNFL